MVVVQLSSEEAVLIRRLMELLLSDVRMEISGTDSVAFREMLKEEKAALQNLVGQLAEQTE